MNSERCPVALMYISPLAAAGWLGFDCKGEGVVSFFLSAAPKRSAANRQPIMTKSHDETGRLLMLFKGRSTPTCTSNFVGTRANGTLEPSHREMGEMDKGRKRGRSFILTHRERGRP